MSNVQEIKSAIARLSLEERAELVAELCGWEDDEWDQQMKREAAAGKLSVLNRDTDQLHASGQTHPLNDIVDEP